MEGQTRVEAPRSCNGGGGKFIDSQNRVAFTDGVSFRSCESLNTPLCSTVFCSYLQPLTRLDLLYYFSWMEAVLVGVETSHH